MTETIVSLNALTADRVTEYHFDAAAKALARADTCTGSPEHAAAYVDIANAHTRLAELAASFRVGRRDRD